MDRYPNVNPKVAAITAALDAMKQSLESIASPQQRDPDPPRDQSRQKSGDEKQKTKSVTKDDLAMGSLPLAQAGARPAQGGPLSAGAGRAIGRVRTLGVVYAV